MINRIATKAAARPALRMAIRPAPYVECFFENIFIRVFSSGVK